MPTGVYKKTEEHKHKIGKAMRGQKPWNTGLNKDTDPRVAAAAKAIGESNTGKKQTPEQKEDHAIASMLNQNRFNGTREEARALIKLKKQYPLHLKYFDLMYKRCQYGYATISSEFSWTAEGFQNFINYIGPYPHYMIKPSIGRRNHDLGYIRGNFRWQEFSENISDGHNRNAN